MGATRTDGERARLSRPARGYSRRSRRSDYAPRTDPERLPSPVQRPNGPPVRATDRPPPGACMDGCEGGEGSPRSRPAAYARHACAFLFSTPPTPPHAWRSPRRRPARRTPCPHRATRACMHGPGQRPAAPARPGPVPVARGERLAHALALAPARAAEHAPASPPMPAKFKPQRPARSLRQIYPHPTVHIPNLW